jgi:hypothetical protein
MQTDMFTKPAPAPVILTLEIRGKIPSFKNNKMLIRPSAKALLMALAHGDLSAVKGQLMAYLKKPILMITKPEYQQAMDRMIASIESQLLCASQTGSGQTFPANSTLCWIASCVPEDDCWTKLPEIQIRAELCEPGNEGATVVIERIN